MRAVRRRCAVAWRQGEEPGTTPGGASDGAGDGREARIGRALPVKAIGRDGDGVALAVIVANEHRAGFELAPGRAAMACQTVQESQAFPIKAAEGLLLQAASHRSPQQVLAQSRRRCSSEHHPPAPPKGIKWKRPDARDLGLDRGRVGPVLPHGYALGTAAASAEFLPATIRYTRSPSVFSDSSRSPSFLRTTAAKKPRTVCGCQPVEPMTVAIVAPFGRATAQAPALASNSLALGDGRSGCGPPSNVPWM